MNIWDLIILRECKSKNSKDGSEKCMRVMKEVHIIFRAKFLENFIFSRRD